MTELVNSESSNKKKIAMLTMCIGSEYQKKWKSAARSKEIYCNLHGYDFIYIKESMDPSRKAHWTKLKALRKHLENYDWIFYSDADAHIMNFDKKLEDFITAFSRDNKTFLIISRDNVCLNSGNFFMKNCKRSIDYIDASYKNFPPQPNYPIGRFLCNFNDQFGMYIESKKPKFKNGVLFVPQRVFNAYPCPCCGQKYQAGDFLIHFVNHKRPFHNWAGDTKMNLPDIYKIPEIQVVRNPDNV